MTATKPINYFFLYNRLHKPVPDGFQETLILLIVNSTKENLGKFLVIEETIHAWGFPKTKMTGNNIFDGILDALVKNLGEEIGYKGPLVFEKKPFFEQQAIFFNFGKQLYDKVRGKQEEKKGFPSKGKIYNLAIMKYSGPSDLPILESDSEDSVIDYKWVTFEEALSLFESNKDIERSSPKLYSYGTYIKIIEQLKKIEKAYKYLIENVYPEDKAKTEQTSFLK
ncbi:hypothetical protein M0R04_00190 [Candidatus Dojkabacteria bacterium]|jgi:hypothetical protein|nr:hypothetical protein [Candidatus Dojkabacteria bacterium]